MGQPGTAVTISIGWIGDMPFGKNGEKTSGGTSGGWLTKSALLPAKYSSIYLEVTTDDAHTLKLNFHSIQSEGPMSGVHPPITQGVIRPWPRCLHICGKNLMPQERSIGLVPIGVEIEVDSASRCGIGQVNFPVDRARSSAVKLGAIDPVLLIQGLIVRALKELQRGNLNSRYKKWSGLVGNRNVLDRLDRRFLNQGDVNRLVFTGRNRHRFFVA